jgi:antitoxin FitA
MSDLLVRDISDGLKRLLTETARKRGTSLSEEAILQMQKGFATPEQGDLRAGDHLCSLIGNVYFQESEIAAIENFRRQTDRRPPEFD